MRACRVLVAILLMLSTSLTSVSARAAEAKGDAKWGGYQGLESSGPRLTLLVYSFLFESYLQDLEKNPAFYKHLLEATSISVAERRLGLEELFENWSARIEDSERASSEAKLAPLSSKAILAAWSDPKRLASIKGLPVGKRASFTSMMLREGFGDATSHALDLVQRLEGERDLSVRLRTLAIAAAAMARDESSLVAAGSIANLLLQISVDPSVKEELRKGLRPTAIKLSAQVKTAAVDFSKIDLVSPENLIGGGVFFRLAGPVMARSAGWRLLKNAWTRTSGLSKSVAVSVGGHAAVFGALTKKSEILQAKELVNASEAAAGRSRVVGENLSAIAAQAVARTAAKSDAVSIDSAHNLAEEILYSKSDFRSAMKYADLFASAERALPRAEIQHLAGLGVTSRDYIQNRDDVIRRFDRYMASRKLKIVDGEAISVLRGYVDLYLGPHSESQVLATVAATTPRNGGNCVARAMNFTAFFYPAYRKYANPKLRFGLMNWTNHIEAVLYNGEADAAMALYPMQVIDRQAQKDGAPAVVDVRQFAAAFLYREKSPVLWQNLTNHLKPYDLMPRSKFEIRKLNSTRGTGLFASQDLTTARGDLDPNPSPFVTARYGDAFSIAAPDRARLDVSMLKRRLDLSQASLGLDQLLKNQVATSQQILQTPSRKLSTSSRASGIESPLTIALSETELGSVVGTRRTSPFGILVEGGDFKIPLLVRDLDPKSTPFKTPSSYEDQILKRVRSFQLNSKWAALVAGEVKTLEELSDDPSFTIALGEFAQLVHAMLPETRVQPWYGGKYRGEFAAGLANRFGALAIDEEMLKASDSVERLLSSYVHDVSGAKLAGYINSLSGTKFGVQVRRLQALRVAMKLARGETLKELNRQMASFDFQLLKKQSSAPEKEQAAATKMTMTWTRPLMTVLVTPSNLNLAAKPGGAKAPIRRSRLTLNVSTAVLYLHFNLNSLPARTSREILKALGQPDVEMQSLEIAEKFLNWTPSIEQDTSFHGELASGWGEALMWMCHRPMGDYAGPDDPGFFDEMPADGQPNPACDVVREISEFILYDEVVFDSKPTQLD
ncbi:hypothetical protein BH10BDE1_BH10BDE1_02870 [soil metagenome]